RDPGRKAHYFTALGPVLSYAGFFDNTESVMTFTGPMQDALNLVQRYQQGELFRRYVTQRMWLVAPAALLIVATSLVLAFGIVVFVGGTRPMTVLLSLLLAPF